MTHKSPKSPKCVSISFLTVFYCNIFVIDKYVIDTILSTFYTFPILSESSFSSTHDVRLLRIEQHNTT